MSSGAAVGAHRNLTSAYVRHRTHAHAGASTSALSSGFDLGNAGRGTSRLLDAALGPRSDDAVAVDIPTRGGDAVPVWVERCEHASRDIARIRENLKALGEAHAKALLPNFDDVGGEEIVAEALTKDVTKLFKRCDASLRSVTTTGEAGEAGVRVNAQRKLAMELNKLSQDFRKQQKDYLQKLKSQQDRGPGAAGIDGFAQFSRGGGGGEESFGGAGGLMQMEMLNRAETVSIERDREVMKILESVQDLAAVMKDLSTLIIDQGTILDRIDYNCEAVAASVEQGREELVKAEKHQKNSAAIMCIYLLLVMIVLMLVIVLFEKA